jgi:hypothetical protein
MMARTHPGPDPVERDVRTVRSAIGRLIRHLGDEDPTIVAKAVQALEEIGPFVVGPLIDALPRARSSRLRLAILGGLVSFGQHAKHPVLGALYQLLRREKDPRARAGVERAVMNVIVGRTTLGAVEGPEEASVSGGTACPGSTSPG